MKSTNYFNLIFICILWLSKSNQHVYSQCYPPDSLALVELQEALITVDIHNSWDLTTPVISWQYVKLSDDGRVSELTIYGQNNNIPITIPNSFASLKGLIKVNFSQLVLEEDLPIEIRSLTNLKYLKVTNCGLKTFPSWISDLKELEELNLSLNPIEGEIPESFFTLRKLESLNLKNNLISGELSENFSKLKQLKFLDLSNNNFSGNIPESISELSSLQFLKIYSNELSGKIPESLGQLSNLKEMLLSSNNLIGPLPQSLGDLKELEKLFLGFNQFNSSLPPNWDGMSSLKYLVIPNSKIEGSIPDSYSKLNKLREFILDNNNLSGGLPNDIFNWSRIERITLSNNQLNDTLDQDIGKLEYLYIINLQNNEFHGNLIQNFSRIDTLYSINFKNNNLTGTIPSMYGSLYNLNGLYLSYNQLSGEIPSELAALFPNISYGKIKLEYNRLTGCIPMEFENFCSTGNYKINFDHNEELEISGVDVFERFCNNEDQNCLSNLDDIPFEIDIYPNPVEDFLRVRIEGDKFQYVKLFDFMGTEVYSNFDKNRVYEIPVAHLTSGIYILEVKVKSEILIKKVVVN